MFHTPAGSECLPSPCGSLRHSGGSSGEKSSRNVSSTWHQQGILQQLCLRTVPLWFVSGPVLHQLRGNLATLSSPAHSPHPRLGEGSLLPLLLRMNIPILVTHFGKPVDWFSSINSPLPKAHVPSLGKQLQLQDSRLRGLCVSPVLPYSILPSTKYLEPKSTCLETAEIN